MAKKKADDIISIDAIMGLPSTTDISNAVEFAKRVQRIPNMREFHASNLGYDEFETALTGLSGAFFNGKSSRTYITKLKKLKASSTAVVVTDDFI